MKMKVVEQIYEASVVTHSAPHHGGEVFATAIIAAMEFVNVYRTRNVAEITQCKYGTYVVDIGGIYDPEEMRFDPHGRGFNETRSDGTKYSSAGLLWKELGVEICVRFTSCDVATAIEATKKVDEMLIKGIDMVDNGKVIPGKDGIMSVSQAMSLFNPNWDEELGDSAFVTAVEMAYAILERTIKSCIAAIKGRRAVERLIEISVDGIMALPRFINGWIETITTSTNPKADGILYGVIKNLQGEWDVRAVPLKKNPRAQRKLFPEEWRGLSGEELQKVTGVNDAIFCHAEGFICGAKSYEAAMQLARLAIAE